MRRATLLSVSGVLFSALLASTACAADDPLNGRFTIDEAVKGLAGSGTLTAVIDTTMGTFTCELFEKDAPNTVANFVGLARGLRPFFDPIKRQWTTRPFYNGLIFHRVIPRFMIQGGDVQGTGSSNIGYSILDETNANHRFDRGGIMAMANRGPNTGDSQFFITEVPTPALDDGGRAGGHYQIFGACAEVDLVKKIAAVETAADRPLTEVKIKTVTIKRAGGTASVQAPSAAPAAKSATPAAASPTKAAPVGNPKSKKSPPG